MAGSVKSVAVFCGSRMGNSPLYRTVAEQAGQILAKNGVKLVYGGGSNGLMGVVADSTLKAGGTVTGIIPHFLHSRENMHEGVTDLIVVDSMHERKQIMFDTADAYWILPGGFGTFDETMEILTWKQLQRHAKPILLVNADGWGDALIAMLDASVKQGFAESTARAKIEVVPDVEAAFACSISETRQYAISVEQF